MPITRPTPRALNKPSLLLGIPVQAVTIVCAIYAITMLTPFKLISAVVCLAALAGIRVLVSKDVRYPILFIRALFQKAVYDPKIRRYQ